MKVTFEIDSQDDLDTLIEIVHNTIMDLEDNGNDGNPEAQVLRAFVKQIERK